MITEEIYSNPIYHSMNSIENWVPVIWNGIIIERYIISNKGRVYDRLRNRFLSISADKDGYRRVSIQVPGIGVKTVRIHRIELMSFYYNPNFNELQVNHKDGIKTNLDIDNLEWITPIDNTRHGWDTGLNNNRGIYHPNAKYDESIIRTICEYLDQGLASSEICDKFQILNKCERMRFSGTISSIKYGKTHRDISKDYSFRANSKLYNRYPPEITESLCKLLSEKEYSYKEIMDYFQIPDEDRQDFKIYIDLVFRGRTGKTISEKYKLYKPVVCDY